MHIGVLTHNYPRFAGDFSGTFIEALCEELAAQGEQVTVWAPYDPAYARPLSGAVQLDLYRYAWPDQLHRLGYMRSMQSDLSLRLESYLLSPFLFACGITEVIREARRAKPDILHAHWILPNGFIGAVASRVLNIPLVVSVPGSDAQVAGSNPLFLRMSRFVFEQASLLTTNSNSLCEAVVALGADPGKFDLIIYGTDPAALFPDDSQSHALRSALHIHPRQCILLCVGRMVHKKGFDHLIQALATPPLSHQNAITIMIGDGDQLNDWQTLATSLGVADKVIWLGSVPKNQIGAYYNLADVLVMPSVSRPADGLNVCVLDAMSCAKPVVGSDVAGNPLAIDDGTTGFIVPEQNPKALANALNRLVTDKTLRLRMGKAGRRRIEKELGWPQLTKRYRDHFASLHHEEKPYG